VRIVRRELYKDRVAGQQRLIPTSSQTLSVHIHFRWNTNALNRQDQRGNLQLLAAKSWQRESSNRRNHHDLVEPHTSSDASELPPRWSPNLACAATLIRPTRRPRYDTQHRNQPAQFSSNPTFSPQFPPTCPPPNTQTNTSFQPLQFPAPGYSHADSQRQESPPKTQTTNPSRLA